MTSVPQDDEVPSPWPGGAKVSYPSMPHPSSPDRPFWRVRFDLASDPTRGFGIDLNGEVTLGRNKSDENHISLNDFDAYELGVSRRHAALRPTGTKLYVSDLGSMNKTFRNGQSIGVGSPFPINNGDTISLGRLQFVVRIIDRPSGKPSSLVPPRSRPPSPPRSPLPVPVMPTGPLPADSAHAALHFEPDPDPPDADGRGLHLPGEG